MKRKLDNVDYSEESAVESQKENGKKAVDRNIKKAKNVGVCFQYMSWFAEVTSQLFIYFICTLQLAVSMATKAASLARELKSIKSDLCFMQERCGLLEEENRRLRDGFAKGVRPEEDDLVRNQSITIISLS